jgi:hypothetical protein
MVSSPINGGSVLENAEPIKSTTALLNPAHAFRVLEKSMVFVKFAQLAQHR